MTVNSAGRYHRSGNQSIPSGVKTKVQVDVEDWDLLNDWDAVNKRFVAPEDGLYQFIGKVFVLALGTDKFLTCYIYINGVQDTSGTKMYCPVSSGGPAGCVIISKPLNAGDYVELYCYHNHGSARNVNTWCRLNWTQIKFEVSSPPGIAKSLLTEMWNY